MSSDLGLTTGGMFSSHGFNLSVTFEHLIWRWNVGECGQSKWRGLASELLNKNPQWLWEQKVFQDQWLSRNDSANSALIHPGILIKQDSDVG